MKVSREDFVISKVLGTIKEHKLIQQNDVIVLGVSGGPDSVCLLHVLHSLADSFNIKIYAVHINHMLRGKESEGDEQYVKRLCGTLGVPLFIESFNIGRISAERGISLEEAGREVRYRQFELIAEKVGASKIAVAHNKNDQAETVLINLIRGAGLDGLKGMDYIRGKIIRPLLDVERKYIEDYCTRHSLNPRIDRSNLESVYTRNKVRLELIPYINRIMEVDTIDSIYRMVLLLKDDYSFIEQTAKSLLNECTVKKEDDGISLDILKLKKYHPSMQKRVLRNAIKKVKGDLKGIESVHINSIIDMCLKDRGSSEIHLPSNIRAAKSYDMLKIFIRGEEAEPEEFNEVVNIPGVTKVKQIGAAVEAFLEKRAEDIEVYDNLRYNSLEQVFDYDKLKAGISVRNRRAGDVFRPLKSNGTKKLKKYFIDKKIPQSERDKIPLIAKGKEIVWVIGHKISDKFKVTENTKTVLRLRYKK